MGKNTVNIISKIGFILDNDSIADNPVTHLGICFSRRRKEPWWIISSEHLFSFFLAMFVVVASLHKKQKICGSADDVQNDSDKWLKLFPDDTQYGSEVKSLLSSYRNILSNTNYPKFITEKTVLKDLRAAFKSLIPRHGKDKSEYLTINSKIIRRCHFISIQDFPEARKEPVSAITKWKEWPAERDMPHNQVYDLTERVRRRYNASKNIQTIKGAEYQLRECIIDKSQKELSSLLHDSDATTFIPLNAYNVPKCIISYDDNKSKHRELSAWIRNGLPVPIDLQNILSSGEHCFICAVAGGGKSVFLRNLEISIAQQGKLLPLFFKAHNLQHNSMNWEILARQYIMNLLPLERTETHIQALHHNFTSGKIVFLIDGMDNVENPQDHCSSLVAELRRIVKSNALLLAGRPTIAYPVLKDEALTVFELERFHRTHQKKYFRDDYTMALAITRNKIELLAIPMCARIIKKLIQNNQQQEVKSYWDLYYEYVGHLLKEHPTNQKKISIQDRENIIDSLGAIAYESLKRNPPNWTHIKAAILSEIRMSYNLDLDILLKPGWADIYDNNPGMDGPSIIFAHQSLQEFFAAHWASRSDDRIKHIINEYWNPKWREVIKFLAGKKKEPIILKIFPKGDKDDPIHSRLLLAAHCAGETVISKQCEERLIRSLEPLLGSQQFCWQALEALCEMRTDKAHEIAWSRITEGFKIHKFVDWNHMYDALFKKERFYKLASLVGNRDNRVIVLANWAPLVSPKKAYRILTRSLRISFEYAGWHSYLAKALSIKKLNQLVKKIMSLNNPLSGRHGHVLKDMLRLRNDYILDKGYIDRFIDELAKSNISEFILEKEGRYETSGRLSYMEIGGHLSFLDTYAEQLSPEHIAKLHSIWMEKENLRFAFVGHAPKLCFYLYPQIATDLLALFTSCEPNSIHGRMYFVFLAFSLTESQRNEIAFLLYRALEHTEIRTSLKFIVDSNDEKANEIKSKFLQDSSERSNTAQKEIILRLSKDIESNDELDGYNAQRAITSYQVYKENLNLPSNMYVLKQKYLTMCALSPTKENEIYVNNYFTLKGVNFKTDWYVALFYGNLKEFASKLTPNQRKNCYDRFCASVYPLNQNLLHNLLCSQNMKDEEVAEVVSFYQKHCDNNEFSEELYDLMVILRDGGHLAGYLDSH